MKYIYTIEHDAAIKMKCGTNTYHNTEEPWNIKIEKKML